MSTSLQHRARFVADIAAIVILVTLLVLVFSSVNENIWHKAQAEGNYQFKSKVVVPDPCGENGTLTLAENISEGDPVKPCDEENNPVRQEVIPDLCGGDSVALVSNRAPHLDYDPCAKEEAAQGFVREEIVPDLCGEERAIPVSNKAPYLDYDPCAEEGSDQNFARAVEPSDICLPRAAAFLSQKLPFLKYDYCAEALDGNLA